MALRVPDGLAVSCGKAPQRMAWLERLPDVLRDLERRWSLTLDAPFDDEVSCAYVAAAVGADATPMVLKIGMPHMEGEHEIQGLRFWGGDPTVRLLMADDDLGAMLLERCEPGTVLRELPEREQDVVISGLLRRLWRAPSAPHPFRPLSALTKYWSDQTLAHIEQWPDAGLVHEGLRLFAELPRTQPTELLLATDLHAGNVLRPERQPWLVIDPKPFVGDPAYDATQHLFIVLRDYNRTQTQRSAALRNCLASITNVSGCGRLLAQRQSRATIGVTATEWHSLEQLLPELHTRAKPFAFEAAV